MRDRFARMRYLNGLDPERDCHEIHRAFSRLEFPWDYGRGLEVAVWKTCCVPDISAVLHRNGNFEHFGQRRYDDTRIILGELVAHGYDSPRGRQAIRQINGAHRGFDLDNEDMLYVLSTFVYEPVRWIDRWGWRKVSEVEKRGSFHFFREIGRRMNIKDLPSDYDVFQKFNEDYEARRFEYADSNAAVGGAVLRLYSSWYPRPIGAIVRTILGCRLDPPARRAMGFADPSAVARGLNWLGLRAHAGAERLAPRAMARLMTRPVARTYPGYPCGHDLSQIGSHARSKNAGHGGDHRAAHTRAEEASPRRGGASDG